MEIKRFVYVGKRMLSGNKPGFAFLPVDADADGSTAIAGYKTEPATKVFTGIKLATLNVGAIYDFETEPKGDRTTVTFSDKGYRGAWKSDADRLFWRSLSNAVDGEIATIREAKKNDADSDLSELLKQLNRVYHAGRTRTARAAILAAIIDAVTN